MFVFHNFEENTNLQTFEYFGVIDLYIFIVVSLSIHTGSSTIYLVKKKLLNVSTT